MTAASSVVVDGAGGQRRKVRRVVIGSFADGFGVLQCLLIGLFCFTVLYIRQAILVV